MNDDKDPNRNFQLSNGAPDNLDFSLEVERKEIQLSKFEKRKVKQFLRISTAHIRMTICDFLIDEGLMKRKINK